MRGLLVVFTFLCCASSFSVLAADIWLYKWAVEYMYHSPDCLEGIVMGINGQFPGPTISGVRAGDTLHIQVTNKLHTEGVVIHWHGIRQIKTPWADGTASISQCAINPGETFTYKFKVDRPGTYFYHGHLGMQRSAGLYGSLIVDVEKGKKEPFKYDGEFNLLLSDWWHKGTHEQEVGLSSKRFRWIGEPQSLLVNGRGQFTCSLAGTPPATRCNFIGTEQCAPQILRVQPRKTYRIRLASTTSMASLNFAIGMHKLLVVEADGHYVTPFEVDNIDIYSGESYSVLLFTDADPSSNYWVSFNVRGRQPRTAPALTILKYQNNPIATLPRNPPPTPPAWNNYPYSKEFSNKIKARRESLSPPPGAPDRRIVLLNTQNKLNGFTKWSINNISLHLPATPYLGSIKQGLRNAFDEATPPDFLPMENYNIMNPPTNPNTTTSSGVYTLEYGQTIDVILQNANTLRAGDSEIHPWHLHGHDFWVLGYGEGIFNAEEHAGTFNLIDPPLRNTAVLFPYGWTALRFKADNPGVWAFHCHIEPHLHLGMGVIFAEAVDLVRNIPTSALACGLTAKMFLGSDVIP